MKIISENRKVTAILLSLALMLSAVLCIGIILTSCDDNFDLSRKRPAHPVRQHRREQAITSLVRQTQVLIRTQTIIPT